MKMYIVNYTSNMQTYNEHWLFTKEEDAQAKVIDIIKGIKKYEHIQEVYTDDTHELYCEINDETTRVYIYETEL